MAIEITTPPVGLAGYLGSKKTGRNPSLLEETVRGVVDIGQFLSFGQEIQTITVAGTVPAVLPDDFLFSAASPPPTFLRYWLALTIFSQGVMTFQPFVIDEHRAAYVISVDAISNNTAAASVMKSLATPQSPLLMPSWFKVGAHVRLSTGPGVDPLNLYGWYFDIPV